MASQEKADRKLYKPFYNWTEPRMKRETRSFARENGLGDYERYFVRGGLLNLDRRALFRERADRLGLSEEECRCLELEYSPKRVDMLLGQKRTLYLLVTLCSLAAAGKSDGSRTMLACDKADGSAQCRGWTRQQQTAVSPNYLT